MLFRSTLLAAATTFVTVARADYVIDPETVPIAQREYWCLQATEVCPLICEQYDPPTTITNECDPEKLTYGCLCGDNRKPNVSEYSLTIPYFTCTEWGTQCVEDCGKTDTACQTACREDNPCGAQNPERLNTTSSSTLEPTASQTDDGTTIFTGAPGSDNSDSSDDEGAASILAIGSTYGLTVVLGSMFLGFALF